MNTTAFCFWFQGVMEMACDEQGDIQFTSHQVDKINRRLLEALEEVQKDNASAGRPPRPGNPRC